MATGYTAKVKEQDDVPLREYALDCARAFGALITMRDEPMNAEIPEELEISSYHKKALGKASKEFYNAIGMRNDEAERLANEAYVGNLESHGESLKENKETSFRYGKMLAKVARWQSPSEDHDSYREFMISQLEDSLSFDCGHSSYMPKKQTGAEYRATLVKDAKWSMDYHKKNFAEEVKRTKRRTKWVQDLRDSLDSEE